MLTKDQIDRINNDPQLLRDVIELVRRNTPHHIIENVEGDVYIDGLRVEDIICVDMEKGVARQLVKPVRIKNGEIVYKELRGRIVVQNRIQGCFSKST